MGLAGLAGLKKPWEYLVSSSPTIDRRDEERQHRRPPAPLGVVDLPQRLDVIGIELGRAADRVAQGDPGNGIAAGTVPGPPTAWSASEQERASLRLRRRERAVRGGPAAGPARARRRRSRTPPAPRTG